MAAKRRNKNSGFQQFGGKTIHIPADKIGSYKPTPLADKRMTSEAAEERARRRLEAAKWHRSNKR
jgi:hypothetical protein